LEKVEQRELKKNHAYCLTATGIEEVGLVINSSEALFDQVTQVLLRDTSHEISFETGASIFRKFVFECFARFGHAMARNVTGHMSREDLLRSTDVDAAFQASVTGKALSTEAVESMRARCFGFLKSSDPDSERLKFYLTQGYYFTQLLGFENGKFNPLNENAFSGSVFYLDTNVLLGGVLYRDEIAALFQEMVQISKRIGIELRVTRATIDEARFVASSRLPLIKQIVEVVPEELAERTNDQFLQVYLLAREETPQLTPEEFLEPFDRLSSIITDEMHLIIDDRTAEEIITGRDYSKTADIMNEAAICSRGWGKSDPVLIHDVCHCLAIQDIRATKNKAWFLTRDKTLVEAASKLADDQLPFCFELMGFLHSISPFLTTVNEEQSFADFFSDFIEEQIFQVGNLFDAQELALMAEYNEDVMSTSPDLLVKAFDYVKSKTLRGRPYNKSNIPSVSLELKKFLSSSKDEQMSAIEAERERFATEARSERQKREEAEERNRQERSEKEGLRKELERSRQNSSETFSKLDGIRTQMSEQQKAANARDQRRRGIYVLAGLLGGVFIWTLNDSILAIFGQKIPLLLQWSKYSLICLNAAGALLFSVPTFIYLKHMGWQHSTKVAVYTMVILLTLVFSKILDKEAISSISDYAGVAGLIVLVVAAALIVEKTAKSN